MSLTEFDPEDPMSSSLFAARVAARAINAEDLAKYLDNPEELAEAIQEAPEVLSLSWEAASPAGSGAIVVRRWHDMYFLDSLDWGLEGPVESLDAVLADERFRTPDADLAWSLSSREIPHDSLLQVAARLVERGGERVCVNGRDFERAQNGTLSAVAAS
jgi:hypothetical protein